MTELSTWSECQSRAPACDSWVLVVAIRLDLTHTTKVVRAIINSQRDCSEL